jgi:hypothetical protein
MPVLEIESTSLLLLSMAAVTAGTLMHPESPWIAGPAGIAACIITALSVALFALVKWHEGTSPLTIFLCMATIGLLGCFVVWGAFGVAALNLGL